MSELNAGGTPTCESSVELSFGTFPDQLPFPLDPTGGEGWGEGEAFDLCSRR